MAGYALELDKKKVARAYGRSLRISTKYAIALCKAINRKTVKRSKALLQNLVDEKESLGKKFYTNASKEMLAILKSAESNAKFKFKDFDAERMIVHASAHKGFSFRRPRTRRKFAGRHGKMTNVQIVLTKN